MIDREFWQDRRVLVTGHTGFKGGWLCSWLHLLGAKTTGLSLEPTTEPNLFSQARIANMTASRLGDIRDSRVVDAVFAEARPEIIIHMAAQSLVLESYRKPVETFSTNVMGTVNVLDAARRTRGIRAVLVITTDKCYENREWHWPYRENDALGGHDCYATSKACAELATAGFVSSFLDAADIGVATVRAGNVIGGGDWSRDRLIPDAARAFLQKQRVALRNPTAVRPWQHVLEPLGAYLALAQRLYAEPRRWHGGWNVGPDPRDALSVRDVIAAFAAAWGTDAEWDVAAADKSAVQHEAHVLRLDTTKIRTAMGWRPRLPLSEAVEWTARWYKRVAADGDGDAATRSDIEQYEALRS